MMMIIGITQASLVVTTTPIYCPLWDVYSAKLRFKSLRHFAMKWLVTNERKRHCRCLGKKEQVGLFAFCLQITLRWKAFIIIWGRLRSSIFRKLPEFSLVYWHFLFHTTLWAPTFFAFHWLDDTWYFPVQLKCFLCLCILNRCHKFFSFGFYISIPTKTCHSPNLST